MQRRHLGGSVTRHLAAYWLKRAYELAKVPKPDGSLWHAFRRLWGNRAQGAAGKGRGRRWGWKDVTTLIDCYQQPDEETLRHVVEFQGSTPHRPGPNGPGEITKITHTLTHTPRR